MLNPMFFRLLITAPTNAYQRLNYKPNPNSSKVPVQCTDILENESRAGPFVMVNRL